MPEQIENGMLFQQTPKRYCTYCHRYYNSDMHIACPTCMEAADNYSNKPDEDDEED